MGRGIMMRWACAVAGVAMVVSGCDCNPPPPVDCTDATITFETPTSGQTVDSPFEVSVIAKLSDGTAFPFSAATLAVNGTSVTGTVSGNRATFTGVAAGAGEVGLTATIAEGSCSKSSAVQVITVRDTCSTPAVTAVEFPQDVGPLGVLNRSELPVGTFMQVKVTAMCVPGVQVRIMRGTTVVGPLTAFVNGVADITTTLPDSDSARYDLFAELVRNGAAINTPSSNAAALASIQVSRGLPACAVTTTGSYGPTDDADLNTAGFQMRVTGTMAATSSGTMALNGQTPVGVTPSMTGDVSNDFTLSTSGAYTVTLTCNDANGNTNTATGSFSVDFDPPTITFVSPANVDGGAIAVVTQSPLQVQVATNAENGSLAEVFRNGTSVGTGTVMNGMVTLSVPFGLDGTYTITVHVRDAAGNEAVATLMVTVTLDGCGAIFSRPGACPALLTPAQLSSGTYSFQTTSKAACANQPAALFRADVLADGGTGAEVASGVTTVAAGGQANFPPVTLASGDYVFRGVVTNVGVDAGTSEAACRVTVDLDGPVITSPTLPTGQSSAIITANQDTQPGTPGAQRALGYSARVPIGGRVDACTTQAIDPVTAANRPTSTECGSGWYLLHQAAVNTSSFTFPEGSYSIKLVVVGGGLAVAPSSPALALLVDSVRPCVNGISRRLPQDGNGDGRLNISELNGQAPQLEFATGCGDSAPATLAATSPVVVRDVSGGVAGATRTSAATFANGVYTVTLTGAYAAEIDINLFVELTDIAGNKNLLASSNDPATFSFRVDPVAPTCAITSPTASLLGISQVPGGTLDVFVATAADVGPNGVSVTFTGQTARALTPSLSQAQTTYVLTGDATYAIGATCTDQSGNVTNATGRSTHVDLVAPTCNIIAPTNNSASSSNDVTTTVVVTGVNDGDIVTITSSLAGISNNALTVASGTATRLVRYANGTQTVTASIADAAGNACFAPNGGARQAQLTVNSTSCNLDFVANGSVITNANGSWINRASVSNAAGTSPVTVVLGAVTSDCGAGRNVYLYQGAPSQNPTGTPQVTNASGVVSFSNVSVSDAQQWTVTIDNGAGVLTHRSFAVNFAVPTLTSIGLQRSGTNVAVVTVARDASLTFGAASGNHRVETATATDMIFGDLDGTAADAQFQLTLGAIDGARVGSLTATLDILDGSTVLTSIPVNATPFTASVPRLHLVHRTDETTTSLVIRITSPADNVYTSTHSAEVDVIPPSAPSVTQTLGAARNATVNLSWAAVYDDGATSGSGSLIGGAQPAGYDVRWTTSSVPSNDSMALESDYFASTSKPDGITDWSASTINKALTVPPLNTYFIAVRARDEVGNYSAFSAPTGLSNFWGGSNSAGTVSLTGAAGTAFGQNLAMGRINSDGLRDLVVAAPNRATNIGSVFVYYGDANLASQTACVAPACQELQPPDGQAGLFGTDVSVGNVGDAASEGRDDVVIAQPTWSSSSTGRAFIFFGRNAASIDATTFIEIRGVSGGNFASTARVIDSIDGDSLSEIAFSAHGFNSGQGRLFIFKGRSIASWQALQTTNGGNIPMTAADWVIDGPSPTAVNGNQFGRQRWGFRSLGDLNGDSVPEFSVPISKETDGATPTPGQLQKVFIFSGSAVAAASAPIAASTALNVLTPQLPVGTSTSFDAFGRSVVGDLDVIGSTAKDLVVSYPQAARIHIYTSPLSVSPMANAVETISGAQLFGFITSAGDVTGDGKVDILAGEAQATLGRVWLLSQRNGTTAFDTGIGSGSAFFSSELKVTTASSRFGRMNLIGDFTGEGSPEVVVGDEGLANVQIWK